MRVRQGRRPFAVRFAASSAALLGVLLVQASPGAARPDPGADEQATSGGPPATGTVDLATVDADRWIVQLAEPSVARRASDAAGGDLAALDLSTPANATYRDQLEGAAGELRCAVASRVAPGAEVERTYQVVVNGLAVAMTSEEAAAVRALPGVRAVTPDVAFQLDMYATPAQIGAPGGLGPAGQARSTRVRASRWR